MKINFEEIIEKAQQRAEKLKEFQAFAKDAEGRADEMLEALAYFARLASYVKALDLEGKELLGPVSQRAQHIGDWAGSQYRSLTDGPAHLNIRTLVDDLQ